MRFLLCRNIGSEIGQNSIETIKMILATGTSNFTAAPEHPMKEEIDRVMTAEELDQAFESMAKAFPSPVKCLENFRANHPDWSRRLDGNDPIYEIPLKAIEECCSSPRLPPGRNTRPPLFEKEQAEAEREFTAVCNRFHWVGCWKNNGVPFPLLKTVRIAAAQPFFEEMQFRPEQQQQLLSQDDRLEEIRSRSLGTVGWLLTDPQFLKEIAKLQVDYDGIPRAGRPSFPLKRVIVVPEGIKREVLQEFEQSLKTLLDRWGLIELITWDLPNPQGPMFPNVLPKDSVARPSHGVEVYIPNYFLLKGSDDLFLQARELQGLNANSQGIDASFAGNSHYETYGQMFRIMLIEKAIRQRFETLPRGAVDRIERSAAAALDLGIERVRCLRKWITRCQKGQRIHIKALCVKA